MSNILTNNINPRSGNLITIGGANDRVSIAGTLTYEDVANIDSVGIITAQAGIRVSAGSSIGIGADNPAASLQIKNTSAGGDPTHLLLSNVSATQGTTSSIYFAPNLVGTIRAAAIKGLNEDGGNSTALTFFTNPEGNLPVERVRIDSGGNVLIGKTITGIGTFGTRISSGLLSNTGDSSSTNLAANAGGSIQLANNNSTDNNFSNIGGYNSNGLVVSQIDFINTNHSSRTGDIAFLTHNGTTMPERMRLNSSGILLVNCTATGTTRNDSPLQIETGSSGNALNLRCRSSDDIYSYLNFTNNAQTNVAAEIYIDRNALNNATNLNFSVAAAGVPTPTNRMKISTLGTTHFTNTGSYYGSSAPSFHSFDSNLAQWTLGVRNSGAQPYGIRLKYDTTVNNTSNQFIYASDASLKFAVNSNGGIENYSGNNSNLSDEREKKNIVSLETKWSKVKNWDLKKFHYNEDADTDDLRYGVIAQEVEIENPELVTSFTKQRAEDAVLDDEGNVVTPAQEEILRKGVKEQQMMWMAIKALQEAMTRIETLEQRLTDAGL